MRWRGTIKPTPQPHHCQLADVNKASQSKVKETQTTGKQIKYATC